MGFQWGCSCVQSPPPRFLSNGLHFSSHTAFASSKQGSFAPKRSRFLPGFHDLSKSSLMVSGSRRINECSVPPLSRGFTVCASNQEVELSSTEQKDVAVSGVEPFRGKAGSISFVGLTHQLVEEGKLVSAPFNESAGSLFWVLAPVALILSLVVPQFLAIAIDGFFDSELTADIVSSICSEVIFYIGLATYLNVTDSTQRPYLQYSQKRWGLITGLKGYLSSAFFTMGFKIFAPLFAVYVTWPMIGLPAFVSVAPLLSGCLAQFAFEKYLDKRGSSCWPLVPIIFEVYRIYQLTKGAQLIEKLMFAMKGLPLTPQVLERSGALVSIMVTFQVLGMVCLWSLLTFLQRLFPSRPVAENY
ncbi:tRNA-processing ribonuclease BN [Heracleum sosnowskyi]|uniref:tRNA-processing ribonuclease BN n=1 Tax=Heracleum sosnowskyi TaxID=360622 RepID=A0AAD8MY83_9APIA|nr:tRNA-processing ribonuclease BN [Heracleum sosnowskyi]